MRRNLINTSIVIILCVAVSLGCLGPSEADTRCEGVVTEGSKEFKGKAKDENQAGLNSCNLYCLENDEQFEQMYQEWLKSDQAKRMKERNNGKVSRDDAAIENKSLLNYVTKVCAKKCVQEANKGKHTLKTSCK